MITPFNFTPMLNKHLIIFPFLSILYLLGCKSDSATTKLQPDLDNGGLYLPDSFGAIMVADSVGSCRHIAVNKNGDIYAKLRRPIGINGSVAARDVDGDGKVDIIERFGDYENDGVFATEMRIHNGYLYFSSELAIYRVKLEEGQLIPKGKSELLVRDLNPIRWHNAKSLAFDDKNGMYITFSAPTNVCEDWESFRGETAAGVKGYNPCPQLEEFGGVWRFDADKPNQLQRDGKRFATGLRSIVGITWNEKDKSLYAVLHGRDYLHEHAPELYSQLENTTIIGEEFLKIKENEDYGWPYSYYDLQQKKRILAPEYGGDRKKETPQYALPIMALPSHWGPNDLLFYKGDQFPSRYKDGAFVAFHGSMNRKPYPQAGYVVGFIPFENGKPKGSLELFADGFTGRDVVLDPNEAQFRPCGLAEGPDGSLYISESKQGRIWRVLYTGKKENFSEAQLVKMEQRRNTKPYLVDPVQLD
jgi:glucose/arabinose dehydrogenase